MQASPSCLASVKFSASPHVVLAQHFSSPQDLMRSSAYFLLVRKISSTGSSDGDASVQQQQQQCSCHDTMIFLFCSSGDRCLSVSWQGFGAKQTETQCPWWAVKLVARSTDQGDNTSKSQIVPKSPSDTAKSEGDHKFKHSPAQPRESVVHQPVLYPDTVVSHSTNWCWLKDTL